MAEVPDVQIDLTSDDDDFEVENATLSDLTARCAGTAFEMRWEQAESLYRKLKPFFEDDESAT